MKQKSGPGKAPAEQVLKGIRRQTHRQYSAEEKIRIVLEGLRGEENISERGNGRAVGTERPGCSHHPVLRAIQASALRRFHYTPKHASWLNMVEIEIGVLRGQCLARRIEDPKRLRREITAWQQQRNAARSRIKWMFTTEKARSKMGVAEPGPLLSDWLATGTDPAGSTDPLPIANRI
jgi:hypothetical protein